MAFFKRLVDRVARPSGTQAPQSSAREEPREPARPQRQLTLADRIARNPDVVFGEVVEEAVLVTPDEARVRMLNEVGSRLWAWADGSLTLQEMADRLAAEYEVTADQAAVDVLTFAEELQSAGLVEVVPDGK